MEMLQALAAALLIWRDHTLCNKDEDRVFASLFTNGKARDRTARDDAPWRIDWADGTEMLEFLQGREKL